VKLERQDGPLQDRRKRRERRKIESAQSRSPFSLSASVSFPGVLYQTLNRRTLHCRRGGDGSAEFIPLQHAMFRGASAI